MRIPITMMTQHPDNAMEYISVQQEPNEALFSLLPQESGGLGIDEVMIDFEGKLTPYHQPLQVAAELFHNGLIPGRDVFITPRLSSADKETVFRQIMCIMAAVETNFSMFEKTQCQAIKEVIVPMVESSNDLFDTVGRIQLVTELGNRNFNIKFDRNSISVIPLYEDVVSLVNVDKSLSEFIDGLEKKPEYVRFMIGRSDSALSYGMVSSVLAVILSISKAKELEKNYQVKIYPIMGCGSLPFRGQLTLENVENFLKTYSGVSTLTIQSALRYDHGAEKTKKLVNYLKENIDKHEVKKFSEKEVSIIKDFISIFTKYYLRSFLKIADVVANVSVFIPKNRDRLAASRRGLSYHREFVDVHKLATIIEDEKIKEEILGIDTSLNVNIPRAISFNASMYTIGMPPEFLGTGRALKEIRDKYGDLGIEMLREIYPQINADMEFALKYANPNISKRFVDEETRREYELDISLTREILGIDFDMEANIENSFYHTLLKTARPILLHLLGKESQILNSDSQEYNILKELISKLGSLRGGLG
ncbi:MAG: phosphoenolpyruvate carboxylase [Fervidobacterium sp.]|uniref:Phosphoenolpyruvate carboxylase n=2 Tax=Fervidobacterium gondwanense TaxID=44754 RepID=A0A1M7TEP8_FERGO|nr:phosphoenolpyruvate carboxylase [Fervidobacterium gondwanense]SHN69244.1 phosphoenolpyruvate carboxylase, type 2 [Fervidobacterium gondwanense DSM 13020]